MKVGDTVARCSKGAGGRTGQVIELDGYRVRIHWTKKAKGEPMSVKSWERFDGLRVLEPGKISDFRVTFKNVPSTVRGMFEIAFKIVPLQLDRKPVEIPADGLVIDFEEVTELDMEKKLIDAANTFIMAHAYLGTKRTPA